MERNNLIKKGLVVAVICLLMFISFPATSSNDSQTVTMLNESLVVAVTTDKNKYDIGEPVEVTICVTNTGDEDITIVFPDAQKADFWVNRGEVYLWSFDKVFAQMITPVTISSGETVELLSDYWDQVDFTGNQVPAGIYEIDGWMVTSFNYPEIHGDPVFITICEYSPKPEFDIDYRSFYIGELWFDIKNVGNADAINVSWRIEIEFTIAPPSRPPIWKGIIENLSVGEVERISSDWFIFGLGIRDITIELNATNSEEFIRITRGFFFGPFIWIPKCL